MLHPHGRESAGKIGFGRQVDQGLFIPGNDFMTQLTRDRKKFTFADPQGF
jgi:hypothetical protein